MEIDIKELLNIVHKGKDHCMSCDEPFKKKDVAYIDRDLGENSLYVCKSCISNLKTKNIRELVHERTYDVPSWSTNLWRYMDFAKYVSLLSSKSLFFSRSDCFDDIFEGALGVESKQGEWEKNQLNTLKGIIKTCNISNENLINKFSSDLLKILKMGSLSSRSKTYISCWHENELESEAMWRLYSYYLQNAIAIKTSYRGLYKSVNCVIDINIGRVEYIDFNSESCFSGEAFWRKRKSFEHEKEVRAIIRNDCGEKGIMLPCDLGLLIEEIYVSPQAPSWFFELVKEINTKYSIKAPVVQSKLNDTPFY